MTLDTNLPDLDHLSASRRKTLLRHALTAGPPTPSRRIFVNRTLRMEKIRCIGFDLDWTLAPYYRLPVGEATFRLALERLVSEYGYPHDVLRSEFRPDFPHRGLIVDRGVGTVLKMDRHRYVGQAYLGRARLDRDERARLYRREPIERQSPRFYRVDTLFELPEVNLFTELVELCGGEPERLGKQSFGDMFGDVRAAVDLVHADGSLKGRIVADLPRFLPKDPHLAVALERLRLGGRRLILITNSEWPYTERLCTYLFDGLTAEPRSWLELFDLVVVSACKPGFFRCQAPFVALDPDGREREQVETPSWGGIYAGGCRSGLMKLLEMAGEQVLYVGDHIYADVVSTKLTSGWRTALIVRELEDELLLRSEQAVALRHIEALREELSEMGQRMDDLRDVQTLYEELLADGHRLEPELVARSRRQLEDLEIEHRALRHRTAELERSVDVRLDKNWGSVFKQGGVKSLFGSQVDDFACIYTSQVSNFAFYGSNHYFRVIKDPMVHEHEMP